MKKILLTGATDGIGLSATKMFAKDGYELLLHGRSQEKLKKLEQELRENYKNLKVSLYKADFSDFEEVRAMAQKIKSEHENIDVIINNAGVYVVCENERVTKSGVDIRIAVNTISPYILTKELENNLKDTSRVVNVASAGQMKIDIDKFINKKPYCHDQAYAQSKMGLIIWTIEMSKKGKAMYVSVNPKSYLGSKMVREAYDKEGFDINIGGNIIYKSALSEEFSQANGKYYCNDDQVFKNPNAFALDESNREKIMGIIDKY